MKPLINYKPFLVPAVSWDNIERRYLELVTEGLDFEPMLSLVKYIRQCGLADRLYAYTSLFTLIVTIYEHPEWHRETLHIEYHPNTNEWHFEYYPLPFQPAEREKCYPANEASGLTIFSKYIEMLKW